MRDPLHRLLSDNIHVVIFMSVLGQPFPESGFAKGSQGSERMHVRSFLSVHMFPTLVLLL